MKTLKVNMYLCLTKHHCIHSYGAVEVYPRAYLTSALAGAEGVSLIHLVALISGKERPQPW
jgi:hypothetical protein